MTPIASETENGLPPVAIARPITGTLLIILITVYNTPPEKNLVIIKINLALELEIGR